MATKRTPGGEPPADVAEPAAVEIADDELSTEDPRTPGLVCNDDGTISYLGRVHRRAFMTPAGMVVPPASVEPAGGPRLR